MDSLFKVQVIAQTSNPQQVVYAAMHQDYSEGFVAAQREEWPNETQAGEICVKRLLAGERGHYGCYTADTFVMTAGGWKPWSDVTGDDRLLAVSLAEGETSRFEKPAALQVYSFREDDYLYTVKSRKLDIAVTLDHRMIISRKRKDGSFTAWEAVPAARNIGKPRRYLLSTILADSERLQPPAHDGGTTAEESLFRLAGFFFGDGLFSHNKTARCLRFKLRKERKIAYLRGIGFAVEEKAGERYKVADQAAAEWVYMQFTESGRKVIPEWVSLLPANLFFAFLDGLRNSDGTRVRESHWALDSIHRNSLEVLQTGAHLNGLAAYLTLNNPNDGPGHENHSPCWRLTITKVNTARVEISCHRTPGVMEEVVSGYRGNVYCATVSTGALLVKRNNRVMVSGNCLEHPQITFNVGWFPHSVMQQARTHRAGVSFDVQSLRYTGQRICAAARGEIDLNTVFYLRPVGNYVDRQGKKYAYTADQREIDWQYILSNAERYQELLDRGFAEEHARGIIPFDVRQHFVVSFNLRAFLHFLDLRAKLDAQEEIRALCDLMWPHLAAWAPEIAAWYKSTRWAKARLAP